MSIFRTKTVEQSIRDTEEPAFKLRKALGPLDLIVFGIGVIVGTGIFVLTFIVLLLTVVLTLGIRLSARFNLVVTSIKIAVVLFFIVFGLFFIKLALWHPFIPPAASAAQGSSSSFLDAPLVQVLLGIKQQAFGLSGIVTGAATVFFAYIGFDIVATAAEETRKPQRDMPIGIIGSLLICTILYIAVSLVMTGVVSYTQLNTAAPMATAFNAIGQPWAAALVCEGASTLWHALPYQYHHGNYCGPDRDLYAY